MADILGESCIQTLKREVEKKVKTEGATLYGRDILPEDDTPDGWKQALGGSTNSHTIVVYTKAVIPNQPHTYGYLETFNNNSNIIQYFHASNHLKTYVRGGDSRGWKFKEGGTSEFTDVCTVNNEYSTSETVVGTWLGVKPIYRKVVYRMNIATINYIDLPDLEDIVSVNATILSDNGDIQPVPVTNQGTTARWIASSVSKRLVYVANGDLGKYLTVVVEYTKTTD